MYFDRNLQAGVLNRLIWEMRLADVRYGFDSAIAVNNFVYLIRNPFPTPDPGPDYVKWTPPPFDVISDWGIPAAAFTLPF